jgi:hypothetical protein
VPERNALESEKMIVPADNIIIIIRRRRRSSSRRRIRGTIKPIYLSLRIFEPNIKMRCLKAM